MAGGWSVYVMIYDVDERCLRSVWGYENSPMALGYCRYHNANLVYLLGSKVQPFISMGMWVSMSR